MTEHQSSTTKYCPRCKKDKLPVQFYRDSSRPDGKDYYCKDCIRNYRHELRGYKNLLTPEERFWRYVKKSEETSGCWLWTGRKDTNGYGRMYYQGKQIIASTYSFILHHGPIKPGHVPCHNCPGGDNPACVNPEHLWEGTYAENWWDTVHKGTIDLTKHPNRKITDDDVDSIRLLRSQGWPLSALADTFRVSISNVSMIVNGKARTYRSTSASRSTE